MPQRWRQPQGEDRTEMKKEAKLLRCTLLDGSAWSTEKSTVRRYRGNCDVFFRDRALTEEGGNGAGSSFEGSENNQTPLVGSV